LTQKPQDGHVGDGNSTSRKSTEVNLDDVVLSKWPKKEINAEDEGKPKKGEAGNRVVVRCSLDKKEVDGKGKGKSKKAEVENPEDFTRPALPNKKVDGKGKGKPKEAETGNPFAVRRSLPSEPVPAPVDEDVVSAAKKAKKEKKAKTVRQVVNTLCRIEDNMNEGREDLDQFTNDMAAFEKEVQMELCAFHALLAERFGAFGERLTKMRYYLNAATLDV